jgi:hypothetical protein
VRYFPSSASEAMRVGRVLLASACVVAFIAFAAGAGLAAPQFTPITAPQPIIPSDPLDHTRQPDIQPGMPRELQERQLKRLREEHQKQVFSDAARLVQLATALKQQMLKGDKVTVDAIKDADEIGKLAKRLSERIKTQ